MASCCDTCCDCDCCVKEIKDTYPNIGDDSRILPPTSSSKYATNITQRIPEQVSQEKNVLITFGDIHYEPILELDKLTEKNGQLEIKNIAFGDNHSLMLIKYFNNNKNREDTMLYGYGSNYNGELGIDYELTDKKKNYYKSWKYVDAENTISKMTKSSFFWNNVELSVDNIYVGDTFSIITVKYISDGTIGLFRFELRKEAKFAILERDLIQDGEDKKNENTKICCIVRENFNSLEAGKIKQVAVFNDRILILTDKNELYIKGTMYDMGNASDYILYKKFKNSIISLNMGINNCLCLGENNVIYAMGHNDYCEFGETTENVKQSIENNNKSKKLNLIGSNNEGSENLINTNINGENDSGNDFEEKKEAEYYEYYENKIFCTLGKKIKQISTGARHSLILTEDGKVYCFGDNSDAQCCGMEKIVSSCTEVKFNDDKEEIIDIKAGFNHSIAKSKNGKVYVWGDSAWGKLGFNESKEDQYEPLEVSDMKIRNVLKLFAGPKQTGFYISGGITF